MLYIIRKLGLGTNLQLCLDAGDAASYTSGQSWLDLSGNGQDFFLGANGSATATDPTFTGTAGRLSSGEYFSHDGGDYFTYDTTNETWMENIHKDNATFTLLCAIYFSNASNNALAGTAGGATAKNGFDWLLLSNGKVYFEVLSNSVDFSLAATNAVATNGAWNIVAISVNEATGAGGGIFFANGKSDSFNSAYTSPTASNATHTMQIGAQGDGSLLIVPNGTRIAAFCGWSRALTLAELNALFQALRGRFGI